jgi:hypothetical protein
MSRNQTDSTTAEQPPNCGGPVQTEVTADAETALEDPDDQRVEDASTGTFG